MAVQRSGDRLVVADGPDPAVTACRGGGQRARQVVATAYLPRPDTGGAQRGGGRPQVNVMVVQAGHDGCACDIQHLFAAVGLEITDGDDSLVQSDVHAGAVEQRGALNQHEATCLSASSRSTLSLSAPSSGAGAVGVGVTRQGASPVRSSAA